jgi:membrane fusion protein (multidrug efflux system)
MRQAEAEVEGRKAEVARAKLNLSYATIRAPIDGVVGAALVSEGALAGAERDQSCDDSASSIRSMPISPSRSPNSISSGARSRAANSTASRRTRRGCACVLDDGAVYRAPANCCSPTPGSTPIPGR